MVPTAKSVTNAAQVQSGNDHLRPMTSRRTSNERGGAASGGTSSALGPSSGDEGGGGKTASDCSTEYLAIENGRAFTV